MFVKGNFALFKTPAYIIRSGEMFQKYRFYLNDVPFVRIYCTVAYWIA
jgi:hypothetical protein